MLADLPYCQESGEGRGKSAGVDGWEVMGSEVWVGLEPRKALDDRSITN